LSCDASLHSSSANAHQPPEQLQCLWHTVNHGVSPPDDTCETPEQDRFEALAANEVALLLHLTIAVEDEAVHLLDEGQLVIVGSTASWKVKSYKANLVNGRGRTAS
jgi:hypothetical protein